MYHIFITKCMNIIFTVSIQHSTVLESSTKQLILSSDLSVDAV